jgi:altronate dehydratase small subunit
MNSRTDLRVLVLAEGDNVAMAKSDLAPGTWVEVMGHHVTIKAKILTGHKFAFVPVKKGQGLVKYGAPIGIATSDIEPGDYIHIHNVTSDYIPTYTLDEGHEFFKEAH